MNLNLRTISCDPARLESFLSGELSDAEERDLTLHLNTCEHCRRTLEQQAAEPGAWREAENLLKPSGFDSHGIDENSDSGFLKCPKPKPLQIQSVLDALKPTDDPEMLGRLGGYEVSGVVGAGGMGVVLKAIDKSLDRTVAIKVMAPHLASSGAARKRFAREAKAAAAVLHPNVIAIHSVSNDESLPYLVMPYMRGTSLQKRLDREGPLSLNEILRIGSQIAAGLAAAHAQGLVHRDIKPANILLEDGVERVTITDFGLARAVDDATITHSGVIAGTPQYMSPEQARGEAVEQRSDLFSLGSVLYALCTGHPPFRAESTYGVLRRIIDEEPKPIRELNPEIPEWLCRIVARLMSKQPNNRFESAQEVARLLEECLAHIQQPDFVPLPAAVETQVNRRRSIFNSPRRRIFAMVAAFGLTLLGMILWQASAPPDISGQWTGAEWGSVILEEKQSGEYAGTYTDTFGGKPGTMQMKWSRLEHRFNGTWQEGNDRSGKISVRLVDDQIRGAWGTSKESEINAGIPDMADLLWVRQKESETAIAGFVVAVSNSGTVRISIGHDDGLKIGMRLGVFHEAERRGTLEVRMIGADSSTAVMIEINKPEIPIQRGDRVVGTIPAVTRTPPTLEAGKHGKPSGVETPQRRFEVCSATELSANEATVLEKSEAGREILYLNSSDGKVILLRRNSETLLDETDLVSAAATPAPNLQDSYSINIELSAEAAERFGRETLRLSKQNPSVRLAVLVPGKVLMAPYLRSAITEGKLQITGDFTKQEAERLASELNGAEDLINHPEIPIQPGGKVQGSVLPAHTGGSTSNADPNVGSRTLTVVAPEWPEANAVRFELMATGSRDGDTSKPTRIVSGISVRFVANLYKQVQNIAEIMKIPQREASRYLDFVDLQIERQNIPEGGTLNQTGPWEPLPLEKLGKVLEDSPFALEMVTPQATRSSLTMPFPVRLDRPWTAAEVSHAKLEEFKLSADEQALISLFHKSLSKPENPDGQLVPNGELNGTGFSRFANPPRRFLSAEDDRNVIDHVAAEWVRDHGEQLGEIKDVSKFLEACAGRRGRLLLVRFLDVTVEPGTSYSYRVRIAMKNPDLNLSAGGPADHPIKEDSAIFSDWSAPTEPVTLQVALSKNTKSVSGDEAAGPSETPGIHVQ